MNSSLSLSCKQRRVLFQWESVYVVSASGPHSHSQHLGVFAPLLTLLVSRCCINSCCKSARSARSSLICSLIWDMSCCIWRMAVHSCRRVGVISSFSRPASRELWSCQKLNINKQREWKKREYYVSVVYH